MQYEYFDILVCDAIDRLTNYYKNRLRLLVLRVHFPPSLSELTRVWLDPCRLLVLYMGILLLSHASWPVKIRSRRILPTKRLDSKPLSRTDNDEMEKHPSRTQQEDHKPCSPRPISCIYILVCCLVYNILTDYHTICVTAMSADGACAVISTASENQWSTRLMIKRHTKTTEPDRRPYMEGTGQGLKIRFNH